MKLCGVMVKGADSFRLHPTSILDVYKVFWHLDMLWMGIWAHLCTLALVQEQGHNLGKWGMGDP